MPRSSSGTRKVARSLTTARSEHIAISRPPPWQIPLTAETTGLTPWPRVAGGDDRLDALPQDVERQHVERARRRVEVGPLVADLLTQVAAGNEGVAGAGDQQACQLGVRVHPADRVADAEVHRLRQRVP